MVEYISAGPPAGTGSSWLALDVFCADCPLSGLHCYVFVVLEQPNKIETAGIPIHRYMGFLFLAPDSLTLEFQRQRSREHEAG